MKVGRTLSHWMLALFTVAFAPLAMASSKTLIEMNGTTPAPALAKSWQKVKAGEYQFTLDPSKEIKSGVPVSAAAVKNQLESKMSGVTVTDKGNNVVDVTYSGDEQTFLNTVAQTKIRAPEGATLALESSTSQGGIRANPGNRMARAGEVKGTIIDVKPGLLTLRVNDTKASSVKNGSKVKLKTDSKGMTKTETIFFMPDKVQHGTIIPKAGSVTNK